MRAVIRNEMIQPVPSILRNMDVVPFDPDNPDLLGFEMIQDIQHAEIIKDAQVDPVMAELMIKGAVNLIINDRSGDILIIHHLSEYELLRLEGMVIIIGAPFWTGSIAPDEIVLLGFGKNQLMSDI